MYRGLLFLLLWTGVVCSSCHRHRSSCDTKGGEFTGYALDVMRNDSHYITEIIEYDGVSLVPTCNVPQDFFIAKRYLVHNYTVDSEGGVDANVSMDGVYVYIEDPELLRSKRVKCNFTYDFQQMVKLEGIECLFEGRSLFASYQNGNSSTHYRLGSVDRNYVLSESGVMLQLACTDCSCRMASGKTSWNRIVTIVGIVCGISILLSIVEGIVFYYCKKHYLKKSS